MTVEALKFQITFEFYVILFITFWVLFFALMLICAYGVDAELEKNEKKIIIPEDPASQIYQDFPPSYNFRERGKYVGLEMRQKKIICTSCGGNSKPTYWSHCRTCSCTGLVPK